MSTKKKPSAAAIDASLKPQPQPPGVLRAVERSPEGTLVCYRFEPDAAASAKLVDVAVEDDDTVTVAVGGTYMTMALIRVKDRKSNAQVCRFLEKILADGFCAVRNAPSSGGWMIYEKAFEKSAREGKVHFSLNLYLVSNGSCTAL